jgi:hypothetical protein
MAPVPRALSDWPPVRPIRRPSRRTARGHGGLRHPLHQRATGLRQSGQNNGALSQDGAGGIYATYLLGGPGGPINLSYSGDGGKSFATGVLNANKAGGADKAISSVNGAGQGWATWIDNGSVFAQSFQAADAISLAQVGGGAVDNGSTITLGKGTFTIKPSKKGKK